MCATGVCVKPLFNNQVHNSPIERLTSTIKIGFK